MYQPDHLQEEGAGVTMIRGAPAAVVLIVGLALLISSIDSRSAVRAQVAGFYSIDCGNKDAANYTDPTTSIVWTPDSSVMTEGTATGVTRPSGDSSAHLTTLRYFPGNHSKYCYGLSPVTSGSFYIIRATFWMGDTPLYPTKTSGLISFQLIIDAYVANTVNVYLPQASPLEVELFVMANTSSMFGCVARGIGDTPFISSLELRPLPTNTYGSVAIGAVRRPLLRIARVDYGSAISSPPIRYPDDELDRIWQRNTTLPSISASKATTITNDLFDFTPIEVLETAYSPLEGGFNLSSKVDPASHLYLVSLYFAEVDSRVNKSGMRVFDIGGNDASLVRGVDVYAQVGSYEKCQIVNATTSSDNDWLDITFTPIATSALAPFISAFELFQFLDEAIKIGTYATDVAAIGVFKAALRDLSGYGGDPCLPRGYSYPWLNCSYGLSTRITEIDLSNYGLAGEVPSSTNQLTELTEIGLSGNNLQGAIPDLSALTNLQVLDLSSNNLTGPIPGYLAKLPNLKVLHLQDNQLSGVIPSELLQKKSLDFKYTGNDVCETNSSCIPSPTYDGPPPPGPIGPPPSSSSSTGKIVGAVIAVLVVIVVIIVAVYYGRRCFQKTPYDMVMNRQAVVASDHGIVNVAQVFSLHDLELATRNFSEVLGEGGFGEVYKGTLTDGCAVAIKVLNGNRSQGLNEFRNEASLLSTVHHRNVVQLIGYCTEGKLALVYELMPNGSLHDALFGLKFIATTLTWRQRLMIMAGAAQGLDYLHNQCVKVIIHRDVKSSNILLGSNLEGKIADLGISKDNDAATTRIIGSRGYLDPEYAVSLRLSTAVDIYSFGVVLFEIITGRPSVFKSNEGEDINLSDWVKPLVERIDLEQLVDPKFGRQYNETAMWNVIDIAMSCIKFNSSERPEKMSEILQCLSSALQVESHDSTSHDGNMFISPAITGPFTLTEVQAR